MLTRLNHFILVLVPISLCCATKVSGFTPLPMGHLLHGRTLQAMPPPVPTINMITDVNRGFNFTLNNFRIGRPQDRDESPHNHHPYGLSSLHQVYDLRGPMIMANDTQVGFDLHLKATLFRAPNQLTLILANSHNNFIFNFSKSCLFPIVATSANLTGIDPVTGQVNSLAVPTWLKIINHSSFQVSAARLAFVDLSSSVAANFSMSFPQMSTTAAELRGLYSQNLTFNEPSPSFRLVQIYCPIVTGESTNWSLNITALEATRRISPVPPLNSTNSTTPVNNTNITWNNTSPLPPPEPIWPPYRRRRHLNVPALVIGLVLGTLLIAALITIVVLCCKLKAKNPKIIREDGYGPEGGFKQFDEEKKTSTADGQLSRSVFLASAVTTNQLPSPGDDNTDGTGKKSKNDWPQTEQVVIAESTQVNELPSEEPNKQYAFDK